jgi:catechol 2,3-dioxygenase-like lactoylglutathione lyase family enzyme
MSDVSPGIAAHPARRIERVHPIVRADKMMHVVFERSNVSEMTRFLHDFGLMSVASTGDGVSYFRGHGTSAYLVAIVPSDQDRFVGFAVSVAKASDLEQLSKVSGVGIDAAEGPGGGRRVRLLDPTGSRVDVIHGAASVAQLSTRDALVAVNTPALRARINMGVRTPVEPSPLFQLGHVVLQRPNVEEAIDWYMRHIGLLASDVQALPDGSPGMTFLRLDRGDQPTDHHSVAILSGPSIGVLHVAFETLDIETVGQGHQHLRGQGWTPFWGIGRHYLGSQVFDYWKDPVGNEWEHYADGDAFDANQPTGYHTLTRGSLWSWGADLPESMRPDVPVDQIDAIHAAGGFGKMELERARGLILALQQRPRRWMR